MTLFRANKIPVRDSVNVVMNKEAMSSGDQDSGFSLPKEEKIVARDNLETETEEEHPAENLEAWCQLQQSFKIPKS